MVSAILVFFSPFRCWISSHTQLLYIIHGPIQAALLVSTYRSILSVYCIRFSMKCNIGVLNIWIFIVVFSLRF